jgi:hypothetical protein
MSFTAATGQINYTGTKTTSTPFLNDAATLNAGGVAFTEWNQNLTCPAAATGSVALGLGTGGTQWQFKYSTANCGTPQIGVPNSTSGNPAIFGAVGAGYGWGVTSAGQNFFARNGTGVAAADNTVFSLIGNNSNRFGWVNGDPVGATQFLGMGPIANVGSPVVLTIGNNTFADESALVRWNECRVTADITLPVNTATTVCSWNLPGVAKAWAWQCEFPWVISAGTGTNTLAIIANPSQTPTGTTNALAEILTTNTATATEQTTAISASGGTTLLTSPTITPAATVFTARTSGTLLASATAGSFAIQMTAAGTTATAAAKAGSTCAIY